MVGFLALISIFFVSSAFSGLAEDLIEDVFSDVDTGGGENLIETLGVTRLEEFIDSGVLDDVDSETEEDIRESVTDVVEGSPDVLLGTTASDTLIGGGNDDLIAGEADDDELSGNAGADVIDGGAGNDILNGGIDDDLLAGDTGNDTLTGDEGADTLFGMDGNDVLYFDEGDTAVGGAGKDEFIAEGWYADAENPATITDFDSEEDKLVVLYDREVTPSPTLTLNTDVPTSDIVELDGMPIILLDKGALTLDLVNLVEMSGR